MFYQKKVSFKTRDNINLHGWFYTSNPEKPLPCIIMTHGFAALKEHFLAPFAEAFANNHMCVLLYDNRNFGDSEGTPRFEVNPNLQVHDLSDAVSYVQTLQEVDATRIGLWGTSFSGGNAIVAAANDSRVKCLVAQVPFVKGHHEFLQTSRPDLWQIIQKKYSADLKARSEGKLPAMTPVVSSTPDKAVVMKQREAYEFFTSLPQWENQVTLQSVRMSGDYVPMDLMAKLQIPTLFIVADEDTICLTELALAGFEKISAIKKCIIIKGHHFVAFERRFEICNSESRQWFAKYL